MRIGPFFAAAAAICVQLTLGQSTDPCANASLLSCLQIPLSATCADTICACSQIQFQSSCYKNGGCSTIPTNINVFLTQNCGSSGSAATVVPVTTTPGGSTASAVASSASSAAAASTSKAGANGVTAPSFGGILVAALGLMLGV